MSDVFLSMAQRAALYDGKRRVWLGTREVGVQGSTMVALERKGLAEVCVMLKPYRRLAYRLTADGEAERRRRFGEREQPAAASSGSIDELYPPVVSEGVRCRCTHCGAVFDDATPGGSCGRCGMSVESIGGGEDGVVERSAADAGRG